MSVGRPGCGRHRGFTLVELLVGMAMLGMLLLVLFAGLRIGLRSWETAERAWEATEGVGQMLSFMERVVRDARPVLARREFGVRGGANLLFSGASDEIEWMAGTVAAIEPQGLVLYRVFAEGRGGGLKDLWVTLTPYRLGELGEESEPRLLLESVTDFRLGYYGAATRDKDPKWYDQWPEDAETMPSLVALEIERPGTRPWPPVIVPLAWSGRH